MPCRFWGWKTDLPRLIDPRLKAHCMSFQITKVEARIANYSLHQDRVIITSLGIHDRSRYLIITLTDELENQGFGEAATVMIWSGEAAETGLWIVENRITPLLTGSHFDHPSEILTILDRALQGNPFLKASIDIAAWDLWAKRQGKSVASLIGDRKPVESVPTRFSIGAYSVEDTVRLAVESWEAGIRTLKIKTGVPGLDDVARLKAVRERLGEEPILTIDANGAYQTEDQAVAAIEALLPFNLALVEQPTPRDRIGMMARVKQRVDVPILADESIFTPGELAEALDCDAMDLLSLYPGKNGGFTNSLKMAQTAQNAGKYCVIGSNMETDLGQAAMVCLAASLTAFPVEEYASDLMTGMIYTASSTSPALELNNGRLLTPLGTGFGVEPLHD